MPKKFARVNGKLVLEKTRRTRSVKIDPVSEEAEFDAISQRLHGKTFSPPSVSIDTPQDFDVKSDVTSFHEILEDQMIEDVLNSIDGLED